MTIDPLSHFSESGHARMVNVSEKPPSQRLARASGIIRMRPETFARIRDGKVAKGDVLCVADVAAIMGAKRTPDIIPMCHAILLSGVDIDFYALTIPDTEGLVGLRVVATVHCAGQTGVEMEALTAVSTALLTVYDMCKAMDRGMKIESIMLDEKQGGKSGRWQRTSSPIELGEKL